MRLASANGQLVYLDKIRVSRWPFYRFVGQNNETGELLYSSSMLEIHLEPCGRSRGSGSVPYQAFLDTGENFPQKIDKQRPPRGTRGCSSFLRFDLACRCTCEHFIDFRVTLASLIGRQTIGGCQEIVLEATDVPREIPAERLKIFVTENARKIIGYKFDSSLQEIGDHAKNRFGPSYVWQCREKLVTVHHRLKHVVRRLADPTSVNEEIN